ncbi:MAG: hypothetical protein ACXABV_12690 [Candidatus Thorarchaeota archaeon]
MESNPEDPTLLTTVPLNYLIFSVFYTLCIVHAVLFGVTFGFIPEFSRSIILSFISMPSLVTRLFIVFLPLFLVIAMNTVQFKRNLSKRLEIPRPSTIRILLGVIMAVPLLFLIVYVYYYIQESIIGWPLIVFVQSIVVAGSLMTYVFIVTAIMTENTKAYLIRSLRNPETWVMALVLSAMLFLPTLAFINPIQKGYFYSFTSSDLFLNALPDLFLRAFLLGILIPLMLFTLQYIDRISVNQLNSSTH